MNKKYTSLRRHAAELKRIQRSESSSSHEGPLEFFHDTFGNQGVGKLVDHLQLKNIFPSGSDLYEQEADRLAARMVDPSSDNLQLKSVSSPSPSVDHSALVNDKIQQFKSGGAALDLGTRSYFEGKMGVDLSQVRVHKDQSTARFAQSINARAFTLGNHIGFGSGQFNPQSRQGKELLAHELVHTQQQRGSQKKIIQRQGSGTPAFERRQQERRERERERERQQRQIEQVKLNYDWRDPSTHRTEEENVEIFKKRFKEIALKRVEANQAYINQIEQQYISEYELARNVPAATSLYRNTKRAIEEDKRLIDADSKIDLKIRSLTTYVNQRGIRRPLRNIGSETRRKVEELRSLKTDISAVRGKIRENFPALGFLDTKGTNLHQESNKKVLETIREKISMTREAQENVKKGLEDGDIPLHKLDSVLVATMQELKIGPEPTNKLGVDVHQWIKDEQFNEQAIKIGGMIVSAVLVGLCFLPFTGPVAVAALGAIGGLTGVATSYYSFEMAQDLNEVANSQEGGIHSLLSNPEAAKSDYLWSIVGLVVASVFAVLAGVQAARVFHAVGKFSSIAAGTRVMNQLGTSSKTLSAVSKMSQMDDGVVLLSRLEGASSSTIRNFSRLVSEVSDDAFVNIIRNTNRLQNIDDLSRMSLDDILSNSNILNNAAHNAAQYDKLSTFYRLSEKYGKGGVKNLENGRIRFYGQITRAAKPGEMVGRRVVREWNPANGNMRTWMESLDGNANVRIVRPETGGTKIHYLFDSEGNFLETF
jgi:hypothetical protein